MWLTKYFATFLSEDEIAKIGENSTKPPRIYICPNTLKTTPDELIKILEHEGIKALTNENGNISITKTTDISALESFKNGYFTIMGENSMRVVETLAPKKGTTVYDICAAPGGKTIYMAQIMENAGRILAFDIHEKKLKLIHESAKRLGINIINTAINDGTKHNKELTNQADYVLIDAPCSGFGTLAKKPDVKYQKTKEDVLALADIQKKILQNSCDYVKTGGTLAYSTCTISIEENEKNIQWFLKERTDFELISQKQYLVEDGFFIAHLKKVK